MYEGYVSGRRRPQRSELSFVASGDGQERLTAFRIIHINNEPRWSTQKNTSDKAGDLCNVSEWATTLRVPHRV